MPKLPAATRLPVLSLGLALAGLIALALANTDRMIGTSVASGLIEAERAPGSPPVAGSEAFWLGQGTVASHAAMPGLLTKPVALGDRITITSSGGVKRVLEVTDLREIGATLLPASDTGAGPRLLLVTCRDADPVPGVATGPVRFIVEADQGDQPAAPPAQQRIL